MPPSLINPFPTVISSLIKLNLVGIIGYVSIYSLFKLGTNNGYYKLNS
jgi:hypothetical protein